MTEDFEQRLTAIEADVAAIRARLEFDGRLGPRPETPGEATARSQRVVDALRDAVKKAEPPPVDRSALCTTNGKPVEEVRASQTNDTGQHEGYIVLCDEERAKGFVRPYRDAYQHVGRSICASVVLPPNGNVGRWMVKVCDLPHLHDGECGDVTRELTAEEFEKVKRTHSMGACGTVTTMGRSLSETYARDPKFYGATFCCGCNRHLPVDQFVWTDDGQRVGS